MKQNNNISINFKPIFSTLFKVWKKTWFPLFLLMLAAQIPFIIGICLDAYLYPNIPLDAPMRNHSAICIALGVLSGFCNLFVFLATYKIAAEVCQDRPIVWKEVRASVKNKFWSYIGANIWIGLACGIFIFLASIPISFIIYLWQRTDITSDAMTIAASISIPLALALLIPAVWILINYSTTFSCMFVENLRSSESLGTSKRIAKGNRWKIFFFHVILFIMTFVIILPEIILNMIFKLPELEITSLFITGWFPILTTLLYLNLKKQQEEQPVVVEVSEN